MGAEPESLQGIALTQTGDGFVAAIRPPP